MQTKAAAKEEGGGHHSRHLLRLFPRRRLCQEPHRRCVGVEVAFCAEPLHGSQRVVLFLIFVPDLQPTAPGHSYRRRGRHVARRHCARSRGSAQSSHARHGLLPRRRPRRRTSRRRGSRRRRHGALLHRLQDIFVHRGCGLAVLGRRTQHLAPVEFGDHQVHRHLAGGLLGLAGQPLVGSILQSSAIEIKSGMLCSFYPLPAIRPPPEPIMLSPLFARPAPPSFPHLRRS